LKKTITILLVMGLLYGCSNASKEEIKYLKTRIDTLQVLINQNTSNIKNNTQRINSLDERLLLIEKRLQQERKRQSLLIDKIPPITEIVGDNASDNNSGVASRAMPKEAKHGTSVVSLRPIASGKKSGAPSAEKVTQKVHVKVAESNSSKTAPTKQERCNSSEDFKVFYKKALKRFMATDYPSAARMFEEFLRCYKENSLTDNAIYWLALSNLRMGKQKRAIELFKRLIREYPYGATTMGGKTDAALFELIRIYRDDVSLRKRYMDILLKRFPGSVYAKRVKKMFSGRS